MQRSERDTPAACSEHGLGTDAMRVRVVPSTHHQLHPLTSQSPPPVAIVQGLIEGRARTL